MSWPEPPESPRPRVARPDFIRGALAGVTVAAVVAGLAFLLTTKPQAASGLAAQTTPTDTALVLPTITDTPQATDTPQPTDTPFATATPAPPPPTPTPTHISISYSCAYGLPEGAPGTTYYFGYVCFDVPQLAGDNITFAIYVCGANTSTESVTIRIPANGHVDATYTHFAFTATCTPAMVRGLGRVYDNDGHVLGDADGFTLSVSS